VVTENALGIFIKGYCLGIFYILRKVIHESGGVSLEDSYGRVRISSNLCCVEILGLVFYLFPMIIGLK